MTHCYGFFCSTFIEMNGSYVRLLLWSCAIPIHYIGNAQEKLHSILLNLPSSGDTILHYFYCGEPNRQATWTIIKPTFAVAHCGFVTPLTIWWVIPTLWMMEIVLPFWQVTSSNWMKSTQATNNSGNIPRPQNFNRFKSNSLGTLESFILVVWLRLSYKSQHPTTL